MLNEKMLTYDSFLALPCSKKKACWVLIGFFAVYIGAFLIAGLLAPFVYDFLKLWHAASPNAFNNYLIHKDFSLYVDRLRWLPLLVVLPVLFKCAGLTSPQALGWLPLRLAASSLFFAFGTVLISFIAALQLVYGVVVWDNSLVFSQLPFIILKSLIGAVFLSFVEETLFRGFIFRVLHSVLRSIWLPMILSALFFVCVHFKAPRGTFLGDTPTIWDGLSIALKMIAGPFYTAQLLPFANLFVFGILLAVLYIRTRSLVPGIALHAGIVFMLLVYKHCVNISPSIWADFLGTPRGINGWLSLILLILLSFWFNRFLPLPALVDDPKNNRG